MELLKEQWLPINVIVDILYLVMLSVSVRVMVTGMAKYIPQCTEGEHPTNDTSDCVYMYIRAHTSLNIDGEVN